MLRGRKRKLPSIFIPEPLYEDSESDESEHHHQPQVRRGHTSPDHVPHLDTTPYRDSYTSSSSASEEGSPQHDLRQAHHQQPQVPHQHEQPQEQPQGPVEHHGNNYYNVHEGLFPRNEVLQQLVERRQQQRQQQQQQQQQQHGVSL